MRTNKNNRYPIPVNHNSRKPGFVSSIARALGIGGALGVGSALGDEIGEGFFNDEPAYQPLDPIEPLPLDPEPYSNNPGAEEPEPYDPNYEDPYNTCSDFSDEDEGDDFPDGDGEDGGFSDCGDHTDIFDLSDMV